MDILLTRLKLSNSKFPNSSLHVAFLLSFSSSFINFSQPSCLFPLYKPSHTPLVLSLLSNSLSFIQALTGSTMSYHSRQPSIASSLLSSQTFNHSSQVNKIGPWKLGKTLGQGSTGRVLLAEHSSNGQRAAVKVVSKSVLNSLESAGDDKGRDAAGLAYGIEREIIIMKLLNHPNVLRLYDVWETSKSLYLILEYVEGGELFDLLVEKGPLEEFEAVKFFRQIIMGASYCHALGICHRDLKPENLLLDRDLNVKLADFGMAALESNDRLLETSCGSPHYAAPEIVSGKHYHGFESDVWSCGVILFALLTGRLPFDDENIRNLLLKVQNGTFEMPQDISIEAQDLIAKMLEVNTDLRIKTHEILEHPLLLKYEIDPKDAQTLHDLPSPNSYLQNLNSESEIDKQILSNLITLYHGRSREEIVANLLKSGSTTEKIFYFLLLRYRHDQSNSSLIRSLSIARSINTTNRHSILGHSVSSSSSSNLIKTPKKNRRSLVSASSSHRKSVSFQKSPRRKSPREQEQRQFSELDQQPPVPRNLYDEFTNSSTSRNSITPPRSQPPRSQSKTKLNSVSKRRSIRQSLMVNKRGSITTKLISVYAKLAEDSDWNFIDKEAKRTSSDFATLCDDIFDHEEKEKQRQEQLAREREQFEREEAQRKAQEEAERIVREEKKRVHREKAEQDRKEREAARLARADELANHSENVESIESIDEEVEAEAEDQAKIQGSKIRSSSNPIDRASQLLDSEEISKIQQRATTNPYTRPKSRLDPGLNFDKNDWRKSKIGYEEDDVVTQAIRRSRFLGSKFDLSLKRQSMNQKVKKFSDFQEEKGLSKTVSLNVINDDEVPAQRSNTKRKSILKESSVYDGPKTIAEVKIPQVTRKSKNFSASNKRLSVLSLYSTRDSFTDLTSKLNALEDNEDPKPQRVSVIQQPQFSMIPEETSTSASQTTGLRLSYADRLTALNSQSPENERQIEDDDIEGQEKTGAKKVLKLPELPDHMGAVPNRKIKSDSAKKDFQIHQDDESQVFPRPRDSEQVQKNNSMSTTKIVPLQDSTNKRTASGNSFFRKFSSSSKDSTEKSSSFFSMFSSSNTIVEGQVLNTIYEPNEMYHTLKKLLSSWNDYGLKNIDADDKLLQIEGTISKNNVFGLRTSKFRLEISKYGKKGSSIKFLKIKGSKKGFKVLESEIERILSRENVLAFVH